MYDLSDAPKPDFKIKSLAELPGLIDGINSK